MRKQIVTLTLVSLFVFGLSGCAAKKEVVEYKAKELPSWYLNPKNSDGQNLYATGEGKNKEEAIKNALNALVSQLSVSISSTYETSVKTGNNYLVKDSSQDIKSEVAKIRISNYDVLEFEKIKFNQFVVLVSSNKMKFYSSLKQELDITVEKIKSKIVGISKLNPLEQYLVYKTSSEELSETTSQVIILKLLNSGFDDVSYTSYANEINQKLQESKNALSFYISSDENLHEIDSVINNGLTDSGFSISKTKTPNSIVIELNATITNSKAMDFFIAYAVVDIKVKSGGKTIGSNILKIKGSSTQNYDVSKNNAIFTLKKQLETEGVSKILGIGL